MRKSNIQPIKDVLREYIHALGHSRKLKEVNIISQWEKLMGKAIASHTSNIFIRKKILYVALNSSIIRNELFMQREKIILHLNNAAGEQIIEKIVFQ
jgi:predicted nucleic acid-binding Zn ribbon protein